MSWLSKKIEHIKDDLADKIDKAKEKAKHHAPAWALKAEGKLSANVRNFRGHVLDEVKRAGHEIGRIHVAVHEKLPGIRQLEAGLLRATMRGDTWSHVTGALLGLEIQQKAALSNRYAHSMGISEAEQKLDRARSIALAASIAAGVVASAVIAPAIAGVVGAAASETGIAGYTVVQTGATTVSLTANTGAQAAAAVGQFLGNAAGNYLSRVVSEQSARFQKKYTAQVVKEYTRASQT